MKLTLLNKNNYVPGLMSIQHRKGTEVFFERTSVI